MKRLTIALVVIGAMLFASPVMAKKPSKPPMPSTSAPVVVYLDAGPRFFWVHEVGDVIRYNVTVQNKTDAEVIVNVESYSDNPVTIDPRGVVTIEDLFFHEVTAGDIEAAGDILGTVTVSYDGGAITAETSTEVRPVDPCNLDELIGGEVCIWTVDPETRGEWTVSVTPDPLPTRPARLMVSVRDGVPGNWCKVPDVPDTGVVIDRWLPGDGAFDLQVYVPGSDALALPFLDDGQCYSGGAGGDYFVVGNPDSFYLYTSFDGHATVTHNN
jgi:hypothetical protein